MREFIISGGGRVLFNTCLTDMDLSQGEVKAITVSAEGKSEKINVSGVILAIGHSARDTFYMLRGKGVKISAKNFAVGARIEHLQQKIGEAQYGSEYKRLPPADYKLVSHAGDRAAFTFCMCPGGYVMPATSEEGAVVTNGMSNYARDHVNANSALIVAVDKSDFASDDQLAGIEYQRMLERRAFLLGGENYCAPAQRVADFMAGKKTSAWGEVLPSYRRGVSFADLGEALPESIAQNMRLAIRDMDKRLRGFMSGDAVLTGVETRTSSPVRIERGEDMQSVSVQNLYPCGEGAGYAGGITSSAADGLRVADVIMRKYDV